MASVLPSQKEGMCMGMDMGTWTRQMPKTLEAWVRRMLPVSTSLQEDPLSVYPCLRMCVVCVGLS